MVVSAFAGVTDALIGIAGDLSRGSDAAVRRTASELRRRYETSAREVSRPGDDRQRLLARVRATFEEIAALTAAPGMLRELSPRSIDHLLASGEELSARIFAEGLARRGVRAEFVSAVEVITTDGRPGQASPDLPATDRRARARLRPLLAKGIVPVVPGFLGADGEGRVVTLGRGGSDLTATLLGRALSARAVTLWKDVPGFLTADPRVVPDARVIPQLNVREAAELAYYGAKVLHPRALTPAGRFRIFVRPFDNPVEAGTEISGRRTLDRYPVKALSAIPRAGARDRHRKRHARRSRHRGPHVLGPAPGGDLGFTHLAGVLGALDLRRHSGRAGRRRAEESARGLPRGDCAARGGWGRDAAGPGDDRGRRPRDGRDSGHRGAGVQRARAGRPERRGDRAGLLGARTSPSSWRDRGPERRSAGSTTRFSSRRSAAAEPRRSSARTSSSSGSGRSGRTLAGLVVRASRRTRRSLVGVIDRSGIRVSTQGLSARDLRELVSLKAKASSDRRSGRGGVAAGGREAIEAHRGARAVPPDPRGRDGRTRPRRSCEKAVAAGFDVVLANKRPLLGPPEGVRALIERARRATGPASALRGHGRRGAAGARHLRKLVESGDRVAERSRGASRARSASCSRRSRRGRAFSERCAGRSSAATPSRIPATTSRARTWRRKALILGRLLGFRGEPEDVARGVARPAGATARCHCARFLDRLEELDAAWADRLARRARARHASLRYVATRRAPEDRGRPVRSRAATVPSPDCAGTDNQVVVHDAALPRESAGRHRGPAPGAASPRPAILNDTSCELARRMQGAQAVRVRARAPSANIGPGLDVLGLAVAGVGDTVTVERSTRPAGSRSTGRDARDSARSGTRNTRGASPPRACARWRRRPRVALTRRPSTRACRSRADRAEARLGGRGARSP